MFWLGGLVGIAAGGTLIWFGKERIQTLVIGANALSDRLRAKADAIAQAAKK